jgi:DNA-binding beta-propeller fold protein YncE
MPKKRSRRVGKRHSFFLLLLIFGPLTIAEACQGQQLQQKAATGGTQHYEYVLTDGDIYIYDVDNGHNLVGRTGILTTDGVRGVVGDSTTHRLYISHGSDGNSGGSLLAYDLLTDSVIWNQTYSHGIDSMAITPDGKTIYMPNGETASSPYWYVINASDGSETGTKINGGPGPHNTVVSPNGPHVYMGARNFSDSPTYLTVASTATNSNISQIGPFQKGVRPFTINSAETIAYVTTTDLLGFQVASILNGDVLYTVDLTQLGFLNTTNGAVSAPSHGIAISPDEKDVAVIDWPNDMVHIFDVTGVPASAPEKMADIELTRSLHHNESPCAYDCAADGWLEYSRDGRFLYVGDVGEVIDTSTNTVITNLEPLYNTRKMIEVDFQNGDVSFVPNNRASVGYAATPANTSLTTSSLITPAPAFHRLWWDTMPQT